MSVCVCVSVCLCVCVRACVLCVQKNLEPSVLQGFFTRPLPILAVFYLTTVASLSTHRECKQQAHTHTHTPRRKKKMQKVPTRFELVLQDSKSCVLTTIL